MRLGIFGGTFDPIHNAHLIVAREAARLCSLDRVLFIPAANPPHKNGAHAPWPHRLRMVELACASEPLFEASPLEAGEQKSYSIVTIEKLRATLTPSDTIFFIIGADAFADVPTWHRWHDVIREAEFIVVARPGHQYVQFPGARIHPLESLSMDISSSEIRDRLATNQEVAQLPRPVLTYIREHGLYRPPPARASH